MRNLREAVGRPLRWTCTDRFNRTYELTEAQELFAVLSYRGPVGRRVLADLLSLLHQPRVVRADATGSTADGQWAFTWRGVLRPTIKVTKSATGQEVAKVRLSAFGWRDRALVKFSSSEEYQWMTAGPFELENAMFDIDGKAVLRVIRPARSDSVASLGESHLKLELENSSCAGPEISVLALLGLYLKGH